MTFSYQNCANNRGLQIFLLMLIIIGLGLLATQKYWVNPLVQYILRDEIQKKESPVSGFVYNNASADMIQPELPFPGAVTGKTFRVTGKARGMWYFEASFPVKVLDKDGKILFEGPAQAQGEWMTEEFVPFAVEVTVPQSYIGPATLVLQNDNPSGLPENEASVSFPFTIEY